ncbi:hypothetical protein [Anaerosolibacter sp.]|uniref:hypothetical protein n=1 Tax=Anaerosolibacter sp. TaxID=1872527 RepID=UPI0039EEF613
MKKKNRKITRFIATFVILVLVGGYILYFTDFISLGKDVSRPIEAANEESEVINELTNRLLRIDSQSDVQVGAILVNPIKDDENFYIFKVQFNTHSVNLDQYDFNDMAIFTTSVGIELKDEVIWEKIDGEGHHYLGNYKVPKVIEGRSTIDKNTEFITLGIINLDGIERRELKWEKDTMDFLQ